MNIELEVQIKAKKIGKFLRKMYHIWDGPAGCVKTMAILFRRAKRAHIRPKSIAIALYTMTMSMFGAREMFV